MIVACMSDLLQRTKALSDTSPVVLHLPQSLEPKWESRAKVAMIDQAIHSSMWATGKD